MNRPASPLAAFWRDVSVVRELMVHATANMAPAAIGMFTTSYVADQPALRQLALTVVLPAIAFASICAAGIWLAIGKSSIERAPWPGPLGYRGLSAKLGFALISAIFAGIAFVGIMIVVKALGLLPDVGTIDVAVSAVLAVAFSNIVWTIRLRGPIRKAVSEQYSEHLRRRQ